MWKFVSADLVTSLGSYSPAASLTPTVSSQCLISTSAQTISNLSHLVSLTPASPTTVYPSEKSD